MPQDPPPLFSADNYTPRRNPLRHIVDIAGAVRQQIDRKAADLGITWAQWVVLMRIASGIGSSAAELCRAIGYDSGSMTRMLDRLEKAGLICRHRCCEDRRVVKIALTEAGQALYPRLAPIAIASLNHNLQGFTPEEIETLMDFLDRILANQGKACGK